MKKAFTWISYLLVVFKIMSIYLVNTYLQLDIFITPLYSIFFLLMGIQAGHPLGEIIEYPMLALLIALIVSWIVIIFMLFVGLISKRARKALFILSIFIAIPDLFLLSLQAWMLFTDSQLNGYPTVIWGIILSLFSIIVNSICLSNNE